MVQARSRGIVNILSDPKALEWLISLQPGKATRPHLIYSFTQLLQVL
jgi:hypothetical protein